MNSRQKQESEERFACPACGYRMWESPFGCYEICAVCGWEDDAVQRVYPFNPVGANHISLYDFQQEVRQREVEGNLLSEGYEIDPNWRWLAEEDRAFLSSGAPRTGKEYFYAIAEPDRKASSSDSSVEYEYWLRRRKKE